MTPETLLSLAQSSGLASPGKEPSLIITDLTETLGSRRFTVHPDLPLYPASMIKVPIAAALADLWARGERGREESLTIDEANLTENDVPAGESLAPLAPGNQVSLEELAIRMLTRSDNVATNLLLDVLDREAVTRYARSLGLTDTEICRKLSGGERLIDDPEWDGRGMNAHPASDCARLFELIARRKIPGAEWLEERLFEQKWNDKLSLGLARSDRFAHKTGETSKVTHDGGILEMADGGRYIVVVYTGLPANDTTSQCFGAFMAKLCRLLRFSGLPSAG